MTPAQKPKRCVICGAPALEKMTTCAPCAAEIAEHYRVKEARG